MFSPQPFTLSTATKVSPWESLCKKALEYTFLKVFGCSCFPWLKPYTTSKLEPKSKYCVFLGYSLYHKGYKCLDLLSQILYISRHVTFDKSNFPFHKPSPSFSSQLLSFSSSRTISSNLTFTLAHPSPPPLNTTPYLQTSSSISYLPNTSSSSSSPPLPPFTTNIHPMQTRSKLGIFKPNYMPPNIIFPLISMLILFLLLIIKHPNMLTGGKSWKKNSMFFSTLVHGPWFPLLLLIT